jgi:hypothetical protein
MTSIYHTCDAAETVTGCGKRRKEWTGLTGLTGLGKQTNEKFRDKNT